LRRFFAARAPLSFALMRLDEFPGVVFGNPSCASLLPEHEPDCRREAERFPFDSPLSP
jgi:hypothetical protein